MNLQFNDDFFRWIEEHHNENPAVLRLKWAGRPLPFDLDAALTQIECRKKCAGKLSDTLGASPRFYFPSILSAEQSTSDRLASFHSSLIPEGGSIVDLTSGLGIDALHFASRAAEVTACERNKTLVDALNYNAGQLHLSDTLKCISGDCSELATEWADNGHRFDCAFIDPARRAADGSRVYALAECEPDVISLLPVLSKIAGLLVIKMSPMLDITHTDKELGEKASAIIALGTPAECKELIALIDLGNPRPAGTSLLIEATTLTAAGSACTISFTASEEKDAECQSGEAKAGDYIYEAWPAVMKSGAGRLLAARFGLRTFHANTRLYHSGNLKDDFPGDIFEVQEVLPYASRVIKRFARKYPQISVAARNFGISADELRTRLGTKEGSGTLRVYGLTDARGERILIVCRKI